MRLVIVVRHQHVARARRGSTAPYRPASRVGRQRLRTATRCPATARKRKQSTSPACLRIPLNAIGKLRLPSRAGTADRRWAPPRERSGTARRETDSGSAQSDPCCIAIEREIARGRRRAARLPAPSRQPHRRRTGRSVDCPPDRRPDRQTPGAETFPGAVHSGCSRRRRSSFRGPERHSAVRRSDDRHERVLAKQRRVIDRGELACRPGPKIVSTVSSSGAAQPNGLDLGRQAFAAAAASDLKAVDVARFDARRRPSRSAATGLGFARCLVRLLRGDDRKRRHAKRPQLRDALRRADAKGMRSERAIGGGTQRERAVRSPTQACNAVHVTPGEYSITSAASHQASPDELELKLRAALARRRAKRSRLTGSGPSCRRHGCTRHSTKSNDAQFESHEISRDYRVTAVEL